MGLKKCKTLVIELAKKHPDIRFVYTRAYREMKEMEQLKAGLEQVVKKGEVLVFDDCQDYSGYFPSFLDALRLKHSRLIAVSRYIEPVEDVIKARRLNYDNVKLGPMVNVSEIITDEKEIAEDILRISQGNPSIAVMAIEYYKRRGTLRGIHDSFGLMQEILEDLVEAGENVGSPNPKLFLAELAVRSGLWETDELIKDNFEMVKKLKNMGHVIGEARGGKRIYYIVPDMLRDHVIRNVFFDSNEVSPIFKELAARVPSDDAVNIIRMLGIQFRETEGGVYKRGCGEVLKRFQGVTSSLGIGFLAQPGKPSNEILIELGHEAYDWFGDCKFVTDFLGDFCHGAEKQNNPYYTHMAAEFYYKTGNLIKARECWNHALALTREFKDKHGEGIFIHNLALIEQATGDYPEAEKLYRQSLKIKEELGDKSGIASSFGQLGRLAEAQDDDEEALKNYVGALLIFEELKSPYAKTAQKDVNRMKEKLGEEKFQKIYKKSMDDEE